MFWLARRARSVITHNHPAIARKMMGPIDGFAALRFLWSRRPRELGDPELLSAVQQYRIGSVVWMVLILTWAMVTAKGG